MSEHPFEDDIRKDFDFFDPFQPVFSGGGLISHYVFEYTFPNNARCVISQDRADSYVDIFNPARKTFNLHQLAPNLRSHSDYARAMRENFDKVRAWLEL